MKSLIVRFSIALAIALLVLIFLLYAGKVNAAMDNDAITVSCTLVGSTRVPFCEISSVDYVRSLDIGKRVAGLGTIKMDAGTYKNNEFDKYRLYSYSKVNAYIIVRYGGNVLVFNQSNAGDTEKLYEQLKSEVQKKVNI